MVLVQFRVAVPDVERFKAIIAKYEPLFEKDGARNQTAWFAESNPNEVTTMSEWDSHDHMTSSTDKWGDDFNREAGTEGLEWETRIWHRLA